MKKKKLSLILSVLLIFSLNTNAFAAGEENVKIKGKSAITLDIDTGEIIYAKDPDNKMFPASTTKLMTALILAKSKDKNDTLEYTANAKKQPMDSLNTNIHPISVGETMTVADAMDGLLLFSGNDVAQMIADNIGGNSEKFADIMNEEVKKLNLKNTHFVTPNGLHSPDHSSTAYDLSVIGRAAIKNPLVKESLVKQKSTIKTSKGTTFVVENRNKNLNKNGCIGGKTGYTTPAGRCLVAFYERDGRNLVGVVLNSIYDQKDSFVFNDMEQIINWSYDQKRVPVIKKNDILRTQPITYKPLKFIGTTKTINAQVFLKEDVTYYETALNKKELKVSYKMNEINPWKLDSNTVIGTLTVSQREASKTYNLYTNITKNDIVKANMPLFIGIGIGTLFALALLFMIIFRIRVIMRRNRRGRLY